MKSKCNKIKHQNHLVMISDEPPPPPQPNPGKINVYIMQQDQAPKALSYDFKMKTPHNDNAGFQFNAIRITTKFKDNYL